MKETSRTRAAPTRSESQPPVGRPMTASSAKPAARAGVGLAEVVHAGEQLGQVQEHGHEAAEGHEVKERQRPRAAAGAKHREGGEHARRWTGALSRRVVRQREEHAAHHHDEAGRDPERRREPPLVDNPRRGEPGEHGPAHAHPVNAQREALTFAGVPAIDERHADSKRGAGEAEQEPEDENRRQRVMKERERDQRQRRERHQRAEHAPAAVAVGQPAERDPHQRAKQHRHRNHRRSLEVRQAERVLEVGTERAEQAPGVKAHSERERGEREFGAGLLVRGGAHRWRLEVVA
jgi:hypothetical protein